MAKVRHVPDPVCCRTSPQFYRIKDKTVPKGDPIVWITRSRGRATCPQDGSPVVSVGQDGITKHICVSCLAKEGVIEPHVAERVGDLLRSRGPRRVLA